MKTIVSGLVAIVLIIIFVMDYNKRSYKYSEMPHDEKNIIRSIAVGPRTDKWRLEEIEKHKEKATYYDSIKESMNVDNKKNGREVVHDEIYRFESEESVILVQVVIVKNTPFLMHNIMFKSELGFSAPYWNYPFRITDKYTDPLFARNLMKEDEITDSIKFSFFQK